VPTNIYLGTAYSNGDCREGKGCPDKRMKAGRATKKSIGHRASLIQLDPFYFSSPVRATGIGRRSVRKKKRDEMLRTVHIDVIKQLLVHNTN
jgi:hypothetical protein